MKNTHLIFVLLTYLLAPLAAHSSDDSGTKDATPSSCNNVLNLSSFKDKKERQAKKDAKNQLRLFQQSNANTSSILQEIEFNRELLLADTGSFLKQQESKPYPHFIDEPTSLAEKLIDLTVNHSVRLNTPDVTKALLALRENFIDNFVRFHQKKATELAQAGESKNKQLAQLLFEFETFYLQQGELHDVEETFEESLDRIEASTYSTKREEIFMHATLSTIIFEILRILAENSKLI